MVTFVRDKHAHGLPAAYQLYLSVLRGNHARYSGVSGEIRLETGDFVIQSEIAYPPFGVTMTFDSPPPRQFGRITQFADHAYDDRCDVDLLLPTGEIYSPYAGDNRPRSMFTRK